MSDIVRRRADTRRIRKTVKIDGVVQNITGWTFLLTINEEAKPADTVHETASLIGVIADAPNGIVDFTPGLGDVDWIGTRYYDIEVTDALGSISTPEDGRFILLQDKTKSDEEFIWTPDATLNDGDPISTDGDEFWRSLMRGFTDTFTKETRDTIPVLRVNPDMSVAPSNARELAPLGPDSPRPLDTWLRGWEFELLFYINLGRMELLLVSPGWWDFLDVIVSNVGGGDPTIYIGAKSGMLQNYPSEPDTTGWGSDWFRIGLQIDTDGTMRHRIWKESDDPPAWAASNPFAPWIEMVPYSVIVGPLEVNPENAAARVDIAEFIWRRLT